MGRAAVSLACDSSSSSGGGGGGSSSSSSFRCSAAAAAAAAVAAAASPPFLHLFLHLVLVLCPSSVPGSATTNFCFGSHGAVLDRGGVREGGREGGKEGGREGKMVGGKSFLLRPLFFLLCLLLA